ncbi:hypothetical protein D3C86_2006640 [compost metagenome]
MAMNLAAPSVRSAIQIARQTSQLHSTPFMNRVNAGAWVLASATLCARLPASGSRLPP